MRAWLKNNPTLTFGLMLPLLLAGLLLSASWFYTSTVPAPQHDVLFVTQSYGNTSLQIAVVERKVVASYLGETPAAPPPRLWRFSPGTGVVREVAILLPTAGERQSDALSDLERERRLLGLSIPDLDGVVVDSANIAPDGYTFTTVGDQYSDDLFRGLFYSSHDRGQPLLVKQGRRIRVPLGNQSATWVDVRFIGWVVSP